jgi:hypothetical protein
MEGKCFVGKVNPVHISSQGVSGPQSGSAFNASAPWPVTRSGRPTTHAIELWSGPQSVSASHSYEVLVGDHQGGLARRWAFQLYRWQKT